MGLRFRRSIKLAPGLRMNLSGSGASLALGPRGLSMSIGKRGTYLNAGIPGTGLYSRERLSQPSVQPSYRPRSLAPPPTVAIKIAVEVKDDGTIYFTDHNGNPVSDYVAETAKKQQGNTIRELITKKVEEINEGIEALGRLHLDTPNCRSKPTFMMERLTVPKPPGPTLTQLGFFARLLPWKRRSIELHNEQETLRARKELLTWEQSRSELAATELARKRRIEHGIYTDVAEMERFLEDNFQDIIWPRETNVSFEILDGGAKVVLDVDLPEIENIPHRKAAIPARGYRLLVKELSTTHVQKLYMDHVHGIGFRIIGETFAALPHCQQVVLSAYSQRPDPATGRERDDYLYSVRVERKDWETIAFERLADVNVVDALGAFDIRRALTKKGIFSPIEPFR